MVSGSKVEGGTLIVSASVRKTIQSIKEIVEHHSDAEIYVSLKENNMDPSETIQKLLNQEPFHEVRRRRDKRKEVQKENIRYKSVPEPRKPIEHAVQQLKVNSSDQGVKRGGQRNSVAGVSREFRVVRDNRAIHNINGEVKPPLPQCSSSTSEKKSAGAGYKSSTGFSNNQKSTGEQTSSQARPRDSIASGTTGKSIPVEGATPTPSTVTQVQVHKPNDSQPHPRKAVSNPSVVGVYSSSSDPVHVPSPESRSAVPVGAIRRELGAVGVRRHSSENSAKTSSSQNTSVSNSHLGKDNISSREPVRPYAATSKSDQPFVQDSVVTNRSFLNNQYNSRHIQAATHQKASLPNKEWKPKSREKRNPAGPGVIGTPTKPVSHPVNHPKEPENDVVQVQDKPSRVSNHENRNVIIAEHIRVAESDRRRLTFGSFGAEFDSPRNLSETTAVGDAELSTSLSVSTPESSSDENSDTKHANVPDDHARNSGSTSPAPGEDSEHQLANTGESSSPQNIDGYAEVGLVRDDSQSYTPAELQQQVPSALPSFSAYDSQTGYDLTYFRPAVDETIRSQGLPSHYEALNSPAANSIPASTVALGQQQHHQQQQTMSQMYPQQVHVSHYANLMPYRQFISPVYVPPMPMPGYSSNPSYPHPSNGNSYMLMPGGSSHMGANNVKYGIQQFKPIPSGSPTGFGNFTSPTGYAINTPGVVGGAASIEDSSRLKYKDGNFYLPNPQAETPEMWMQTPREIPAMQSASYYNMPGPTPHAAAAAAYMPSHTGHASFNAAAAAAAQSSHMQQFPGLYHPTQPTPIASPHHMGPGMGGNVGVGMAAPGAAPGTQVGAYQQPQMSHLNWPSNF